MEKMNIPAISSVVVFCFVLGGTVEAFLVSPPYRNTIRNNGACREKETRKFVLLDPSVAAGENEPLNEAKKIKNNDFLHSLSWNDGKAGFPGPLHRVIEAGSKLVELTMHEIASLVDDKTESFGYVLASEGAWKAYIDIEGTGLVYYYNAKTDQSQWDPPTDTFSVVNLSTDELLTARQRILENQQHTDYLSRFLSLFSTEEQERREVRHEVRATYRVRDMRDAKEAATGWFPTVTDFFFEWISNSIFGQSSMDALFLRPNDEKDRPAFPPSSIAINFERRHPIASFLFGEDASVLDGNYEQMLKMIEPGSPTISLTALAKSKNFREMKSDGHHCDH